ncbi:hypothetical protein B0J13DRAFT_138395 [Dactylonectria estremocensis]|uniref:Uncharacterized protein n=1 Tax=Dactylonectria estremocensis TaxID=1079267 RepID=A0A9P9DZM8_9HYPO|nr:hypothetical protein B0J13DRAFT_138395 [Dactylonectria estremocensis]
MSLLAVLDGPIPNGLELSYVTQTLACQVAIPGSISPSRLFSYRHLHRHSRHLLACDGDVRLPSSLSIASPGICIRPTALRLEMSGGISKADGQRRLGASRVSLQKSLLARPRNLTALFQCRKAARLVSPHRKYLYLRAKYHHACQMLDFPLSLPQIRTNLIVSLAFCCSPNPTFSCPGDTGPSYSLVPNRLLPRKRSISFQGKKTVLGKLCPRDFHSVAPRTFRRGETKRGGQLETSCWRRLMDPAEIQGFSLFKSTRAEPEF